jgi:hypothetical protein
MNPALVLMGIYIVTTALLQFLGFLVSEVVSTMNPGISLMTFLVLFMGMFWLGWPIAVRLTGWLIPETEGERQRDRKTLEGQRSAQLDKAGRR